MKTKETTVSGAYTWFPEPYHAIRGEASMVISINEATRETDMLEAKEEVTRLIIGQIETIYKDVHSKIDPNVDFQKLKDSIGMESEDEDDLEGDFFDEDFED